MTRRINAHAHRMIGRTCPEGPGGRDCACCGESPGKPRREQRRYVKRAERAAWKRDMLKTLMEGN